MNLKKKKKKVLESLESKVTDQEKGLKESLVELTAAKGASEAQKSEILSKLEAQKSELLSELGTQKSELLLELAVMKENSKTQKAEILQAMSDTILKASLINSKEFRSYF